jgi:hypothetical protein
MAHGDLTIIVPQVRSSPFLKIGIPGREFADDGDGVDGIPKEVLSDF